MAELTTDAKMYLLETILKAVENYKLELDSKEDETGVKDECEEHIVFSPVHSSVSEEEFFERKSSESEEEFFQRKSSESTHLIDCYSGDDEAGDSDDKRRSLVDIKDNKRRSLVDILGLKKEGSKDELIKCWEALNEFEEYERKSSESIAQYVTGFEASYQTVVTSGVTLPPEVLAMKVLGKGKLTKQERSYIIKTIDFTDKSDIYEEVKRRLRKLSEFQELKSGFEKITVENEATQKNTKGKFFLILDSACSSTLC